MQPPSTDQPVLPPSQPSSIQRLINKISPALLTRLGVSLAAGLVLGALLSFFLPGDYWISLLGSACLLWISFFCLQGAWRWAGGGKALAWMMALAFLLRLGAGTALTILLPPYGFDEEPQNAGYVFFDAYRRDQDAWTLARSQAPLINSLVQEFASDQYGGLLGLSALVYRTLSPDVHRQVLVLILGAFISALGLPFLFRGLLGRWGPRVALAAAWVCALYPDGVLFGSSQMREPFLVGLGCIAFWAVLGWNQNSRRATLLALIASLGGMALVSSRITAAVFVLLAGWVWMDHYAGRSQRTRRLTFLGLGLVLVGLVFFFGEWLQSSSWLDLKLTFIGSGWVQRVIEQLSKDIKLPFIVGYGLAQPVLPAAIAYPTLLIWKIIAILRSAGWYLLAPFLVYSLFTLWKVQPRKERGLFLWLGAFLVGWLLISSIRAGGDQWDNPRYRSALLPWLAFLAAWGLDWAIAHRDAWLVRWLLVEAVFVGFFTNWYISRYWLVTHRLPFWTMGAWIAGLSALILFSGLAWDWLKPRLPHRQR